MRWLLAILVAVIAIHPAAACSVEEGYKIPTNFELVQKAKVILLARVKNVPSDASAAMKPQVTLEPVKFLKGYAPPEQLLLLGWKVPANISDGISGIPTVTTLSQPHWSSGIGGCIRQFYEPGELVVAFFEENDEARKITGSSLFEIFEPFARVVETVDGPDDVWVHAVERYASLLEGPASTLNDRIEKSVRELAAIRTPEAQAIAGDLRYHLTRQRETGIWNAFATPVSTNAGAYRQPGAMLYCLAGTGPGIIVQGQPASRAELIIDGMSFAAARASPSAAEKKVLDARAWSLIDQPAPQARTVYRFADSPSVFAALRRASTTAEIRVDGNKIVSGHPLDALLRFASHCEKLLEIPTPTEQ